MVVLRRALGAYLSARDLSQLFVKSIETEDIRDETWRPVPGLLRYQRQLPWVLEHCQCTQGHRLSTGGQQRGEIP